MSILLLAATGDVRLDVGGLGSIGEVWRWTMKGGARIAPAEATNGTIVVSHPCGEPARYVITTATGIALSPVVDCNAEAARMAVHAMRPLTATFAWPPSADAPTHGVLRATCEAGTLEVPFVIGEKGAAQIAAPADCRAAALLVRGFERVAVPPAGNELGAIRRRAPHSLRRPQPSRAGLAAAAAASESGSWRYRTPYAETLTAERTPAPV